MDQRVRIAKGLYLYKRPGSPHWWADVHVGGQRARRSTGSSDRKAAAAIARGFLDELKVDAQANRGYTVHHALADWLDECPRGRTDISAVRKLKALYSNRPAEAVDAASVYAALGTLKPENSNRILSVLRAALNLAQARGFIKSVPKLTKRKEKSGRTRWLRDAEVDALLAALPAHLKAPFEFALITGLRQANVLGLQWKNVDLERKLLFLDSEEMKTDSTHSLPLIPRALELLSAESGKHAEAVFTYRGKPFASPKTAWRRARQKTGITDARWHDLRHTWASRMVMSGASTIELMVAGGWKTPDMPARYAHLSHQHLKAVMERAAVGVTVSEPAQQSEEQAPARAAGENTTPS